MVDCGLYQERAFTYRNWEPFPIPPESIDAVLLTHAHVDHCGLLPKLVREGYRGKIYCTSATADIAQIILLDSARLQEEDAEFKKRRHQREGRRGPFPEVPLYTVDDAEASFSHFAPIDYEKEVILGDGVKALFHDAGHVLGSATITVKISQEGKNRTLLFSGDLGRRDRPILRDPSTLDGVDYVVVESTYGDRIHQEVEKIDENLEQIINSTWQAGGNIIVPSFALQRSQEILYHMNKLLAKDRIPHLMVFLDSPMAIKITEVFKRYPEYFDAEMHRLMQAHSPFSFDGLKMVQTVEESKALNHIKGTIMIIAGSGMCNGGRIKHHLVTNITRKESTILFTGYQAIGTLGRVITDGAKRVRILGQQYPVRAKIARLNGFSSHADRDELSQWLTSLGKSPRHVFVAHGELEASKKFASFLKETTSWETSVPEYESVVTLD